MASKDGSAIQQAASHLTTPEALAKLPMLLDQSADTITANVIKINSSVEDARMRFVLERLVTHVHNFAREVRLSHREWMTGLTFLTEVGHMCTATRQEFILLSDILGLSLLVDSIDHPKPEGVTEGTVLGPFHTHDAPADVEHGTAISSDPGGEPMLVICTVKDKKGNPVADVRVDIWETDSTGNYDTQYKERTRPDGRCWLKSDNDGKFWYKAIRPVEYPIPNDGPVGKLLRVLNRHPFRPSHMHFMFEKPGWDHLITALYVKGDPYIGSDAVFGVKNSLIVDLDKVDKETAGKYDIAEGSWLLKYDFVLISDEESAALREEKSKEALAKLGSSNVTFVNGLPVPDVD